MLLALKFTLIANREQALRAVLRLSPVEYCCSGFRMGACTHGVLCVRPDCRFVHPAGREADAGFASFAGHRVAGGVPRATLLVNDTLDDGRQWRLVVGNARAAVQVARTGVLTLAPGTLGAGYAIARVTHVINAAAVEVPCCYLNGRAGVLYANVVTRDWPEPSPEDKTQRPDWRPALELLDASRRKLPGTEAAAPVTVFVHCLYGLNRSVTTAALLLRCAYPGHLHSLDHALAFIACRQHCEVMPVYRTWAGETLAAMGLPCREAPAATLRGSDPALITPPVSSATRRREKGAGVMLLHDYYDQTSGKFLGLCSLLVRDHTGGFSLPLEGAHPGETPAETAARGLDEEAHLQGWSPAALSDPSLFTCIDEPHCPVVFIARLVGAATMPGCAPPGTTFSRAAFAAARAALLEQYASGVLFVRGRAPINDFLETTELVHARVEDLLAIGDVSASGETSLPPLRDHRGRSLAPLRPVLVTPVLKQAGVRATLRAELSAYALRHPQGDGKSGLTLG